MPEYSYRCDSCENTFSIVCSIREYEDTHLCNTCGSKCSRDYLEDLSTLNASVKLGDNELKTLGHLAQRNTDRMSDDQRNELHRKHNSYKEDIPEKTLPKGMSRIKKPPKIKWTKK
jgi:putative FmdB family regulatory protein